MTGPLAGLRVVELASIGPGPHAVMVLADLGADVVRVERPASDSEIPDPPIVSRRGRRRIVLDLKSPEGVASVLDLAQHADILIEGMRPGVAERLGIGPDECLTRNPRLIYGRMTGWGQTGPLALAAGHDINYIGLTGVLNSLGKPGGTPSPPLNLVGDFGGGSMLLLIGVLSALWERSFSGRGQVVDAAMVDGTSLLSQMIWGLRAEGLWSDERGVNLLDGAAPFYDTYACSDGRFLAIGSLEPQFFARLIAGLDLPTTWLARQQDRAAWPELRAALAERIVTRTRDEWGDAFAGIDACVTPVLTFEEASTNAHLSARRTIVDHEGSPMAAPAPRFSRTPGESASEQAMTNDAATVVRSWA